MGTGRTAVASPVRSDQDVVLIIIMIIMILFL